MKIHQLTADEALRSLRVEGAEQGLQQAEAVRRGQEFGPNRVERVQGASLLARFLQGFTHFLALILWLAAGLAFFKEFPRAFAQKSRGHYERSSFHGRQLAGQTLGVIGLGGLGSQVATVGKAFGMELLAWSQNLTAERAAQFGATLVGKDDLLSRADLVTIHLVLSGRTRGLIGARELGLMKRSAYLINTSRGPIVDEGALVQALRQTTIAGAALDVYDEEPLPLDHPLRHLPNTVITPHLGYVTVETYKIFYGHAVEDIQAFLRGKPVRVIRPSKG